MNAIGVPGRRVARRLIALGAVAIALFAASLDAVIGVSRRPRWDAVRPALVLIETEDRRVHELSFVGADRRDAAVQSEPEKGLVA